MCFTIIGSVQYTAANMTGLKIQELDLNINNLLPQGAKVELLNFKHVGKQFNLKSYSNVKGQAELVIKQRSCSCELGASQRL